MQVAACLTALQRVVACFPDGGARPAARSETCMAERADLLRLLQRQLPGERAARAAAAVAARHGDAAGKLAGSDLLAG
jgi:hypothetical protein